MKIRSAIKAILPGWVISIYKGSGYYQKKLERSWKENSRSLVSNKHDMIRHFKSRFSIDILVETGTCEGEMIFNMRNDFKQIYSIELSGDLYRAAKSRLNRFKNIRLFHGDSGKVLPELLNQIHTPALFWLDAHFSAGETAMTEKLTPIVTEIDAVLNARLNHVMLIDDAYAFGNIKEPDYPPIQEIKLQVKKIRPDYVVEVTGEVIQIYPGKN